MASESSTIELQIFDRVESIVGKGENASNLLSKGYEKQRLFGKPLTANASTPTCLSSLGILRNCSAETLLNSSSPKSGFSSCSRCLFTSNHSSKGDSVLK